jgi:hypothetical protein
MWPAMCEDCPKWECSILDPRLSPGLTAPRDRNVRSYRLDRTVAPTAINYDVNWATHPSRQYWTTKELLDELESHGVSAAKLWLDSDPFSQTGEFCWTPNWLLDEREPVCYEHDEGTEDMDLVWRHPAIDTYLVRFQAQMWSAREYGCGTNQPSGISFANEPTYDIAYRLLQRYGWKDAVIIFGDWEQDWQIRGQNCNGPMPNGNWSYPWLDAPTWMKEPCIQSCIEETGQSRSFCFHRCGDQIIAERADMVRRILERRQAAIEAARAAFPRARLRIFHAATVNKYPANLVDDRTQITVTEMINTLEHRPDFIALSFWRRDIPITEVLDWIRENTGYHGNRIIIDELGSSRPAEQYERLFNETRRAWCWGVNLVGWWTWKQTWCGDPRQHGLFEQLQPCSGKVEFGDPTPGYQALRDLLDQPFDRSECEAILELPPTVN